MQQSGSENRYRKNPLLSEPQNANSNLNLISPSKRQKAIPGPISKLYYQQPTDGIQDLDFISGPWLTMLIKEKIVSLHNNSYILAKDGTRLQYNIDFIRNNIQIPKATRMAVLLTNYVCQTPDYKIEVKDPTGSLKGTLQSKAFKTNSKELVQGSLIMLKSVSVFRARMDCDPNLTVTEENIDYIIPPSSTAHKIAPAFPPDKIYKVPQRIEEFPDEPQSQNIDDVQFLNVTPSPPSIPSSPADSPHYKYRTSKLILSNDKSKPDTPRISNTPSPATKTRTTTPTPTKYDSPNTNIHNNNNASPVIFDNNSISPPVQKQSTPKALSDSYILQANVSKPYVPPASNSFGTTKPRYSNFGESYETTPTLYTPLSARPFPLLSQKSVVAQPPSQRTPLTPVTKPEPQPVAQPKATPAQPVQAEPEPVFSLSQDKTLINELTEKDIQILEEMETSSLFLLDKF